MRHSAPLISAREKCSVTTHGVQQQGGVCSGIAAPRRPVTEFRCTGASASAQRSLRTNFTAILHQAEYSGNTFGSISRLGARKIVLAVCA